MTVGNPNTADVTTASSCLSFSIYRSSSAELKKQNCAKVQAKSQYKTGHAGVTPTKSQFLDVCVKQYTHQLDFGSVIKL